MIDPGMLRSARTGLLIGAGVFLLIGLIWQLGLFQEPEFWVYDHFVQWHSNPAAADSRISLVLLTEKDIDKLDYPLRDKVLSEILEKIEGGGPVAIGLDLYRDLPEPRDGSENTILNQTLLRHPNIISIFLFGTEEKPFLIPPPSVLVPDASRYGFNDFPDNKTIRRAFLYMPNSCTFPSLSCVLAQLYLANQNIQPAMDGTDIRLGKTTIRRFRGNDGGYVNAMDGGYQFLQDYGGTQNFKTLSISEVRALVDPSVFKDKIVLIGVGADSSNDTFTTPLRDREPGVMVHAQIVNQLLRAAIDGDRPTTGLSQRVEWIWMLAWCLVGIVAGFFVRSHILFTLSVGLTLGLIVLSAWLLFRNGYWILVFGPAVVFLLTAMLVKAYAVTHEKQQRDNLMKLFSQHVSPEIAEEIWTHRNLFLQGDRPAAQKLVVTVLFTDLKNYSTISEKMSPQELIAWVNECQSALGRHVGRNGGIINCYMGDGMMAVFGIPVARTTDTDRSRDAVNAVQAALGMVAEIRQMNARWEAEGRPLAGLRVGIFTGDAMAGILGGDHLAYSVIGDTVNTASRLESVDKEGTMTGGSADCRILIGALTYRYIKERFQADYLGPFPLKGKTETIEVYKVLDTLVKSDKVT